MKLEELYTIIRKRKKEMPKNSYVASLIKQGEDAVLQKLGEEATEVIIASKQEVKQRIIEEVADLYFVTLVILVFKNIDVTRVYEELEKRKK